MVGCDSEHNTLNTAGQAAPRILIVGAGLAGLTAAYRLQRTGFKVTVLESLDTVGGRAQTVERDGYAINTGAAILTGAYSSYMRLAEELGIAQEIEASSDRIGTVRDGQIHHLNASSLALSALSSGLLSWKSKMLAVRAMLDVWRARRLLDWTDIARAAPLDFETAEQYALRRLNAELAAYLCDPVVRAMIMADASKISKVELFSGLTNVVGVKVFGLRGGLKRMSINLATQLPVKLQCPVTQLRLVDDGVLATWIENGQQRSEHFAACVVSCPLPVAAQLCPDVRPLQQLATVLRYSPSVTVAIGTRRAPLTQAAFVQVPKVESRDICLLSLSHNIASGTTPPGHGLIKAYWEAGAAEEAMRLGDDEIERRTFSFVEKVFPGIRGQVDMLHITRWQHGVPLTEVGVYQAMADFNTAIDPHSRLQLTGDYMSATGQNTAVEYGNRAASRLIQILHNTPARPEKSGESHVYCRAGPHL